MRRIVCMPAGRLYHADGELLSRRRLVFLSVMRTPRRSRRSAWCLQAVSGAGTARAIAAL
jgi:hypothetical protein